MTKVGWLDVESWFRNSGDVGNSNVVPDDSLQILQLPVSQSKTRWIARLKPMAGTGINELLRVSLSLDVWERKGEVLVVAAEEEQLAELERRRLALVERICTIADYKTKAQPRTEPDKQDKDQPENTCEPDC
jgi:hypothetical protein